MGGIGGAVKELDTTNRQKKTPLSHLLEDYYKYYPKLFKYERK